MADAVQTDPESAGMDPAGLARATEILQEGAEQGLYPGATLWVNRRGVDALVASTGYTDFDRHTPVDEHTIYDLASLTKPVAMASSMLLLCQDGLLHFGQPVTDFFPARSLQHLENVTLHHLLTHTSGLPAWCDLYSNGQTRDCLIDELLAIKPVHEPGTHYAYSCLGYILLTLVHAVVSGEGLDTFTRRRIFGPLEMNDTGYSPDQSSGRAIAVTDHCPLRKCRLIGEVHDGNAYALGGISGNAGLFSTSNDLAKFCMAITRPAAISPFGPAALRLMFVNAIAESVGGQTLGWFTRPNDMLPGGDLVTKGAIGHSGFTGTAIVIDPGHEVFAVLLTNRVCREGESTEFRGLRQRAFNAVFGSIVW